MARSRLILVLLVLGITMGATACATAGNGGRDTGDRYRLTRAEMETIPGATLYEVVQRLRPRWLDARSRRSFNLNAEVIIVQGQTVLGGVEYLRQFSPDYAYALEYMDGQKAAMTIPGIGPGRHVAGAIIIHTKPDQ